MADEFDVFLSHNSRDKPLVEAIANRLRARKLTVWLDKWELRPGLPWQEGIEGGLKASKAIAVCIGGAGLGTWQNPEMRAALNRAPHEKIPVIPVLLPGCPDTPQLALFLEELTWVDLRQGLSEAGIALLIWGITGVKSEPAAEAQAGDAARPGRFGPRSVLRLRALVKSGDFDDYWTFHEAQERDRNHLAQYADRLLPILRVPAHRRRGSHLHSVK